jgi:hypothetical protein
MDSLTDPTFDMFNWLIISKENKLPNPSQSKEVVTATPNHLYDLYNRNEKEAIRYGERKYGINLVWGDPDTADNIRFERPAKASGPMKSGDLVAINVKKGGFLKYQKREYGINLVWSDTPVFEWRLAFSAPGESIRTGVPICIFNTVAGDILFYDPRTYGINLKWLKDKGKFNKGWYERLLDKVVQVGTEAKKINEVVNWLKSLG